jgi:DNA mismatch repair protein MutS2
MPFAVAQKALERLEWSALLARLAAHVRTPAALARLADAGSLFEPARAGVEDRLAETGEARALLGSGEAPPLDGVADVAGALERARKGGALDPRELFELGATLRALRLARDSLAERAERAPRLADLAASLPVRRELEREILRCIDPAGEVRDEASPALAAARRSARELAGEIQVRIERILRDPDVAAQLSDQYFTVRNDRYVLPVRSDSRGRVRGIVHDASASGTTLFVEPEALVPLNNRHKQAEIEAQREVLRVLRALSADAAEAADAIGPGVATLAAVDLAFARARFADELAATAPDVLDEGVLRLPQLRHPGLPPDEAVPNDLRLGEGARVLVLSGPNAGGKTVAMKAMALAVLMVRAGMHVPAGAGARVDLFDAVLCDIGDGQSIGESLSTFSAHMASLAAIVEQASPRTFVALDEVGDGTDPSEGAALAQSVLEALAARGARVVATTHYGLLKEMAEVDPRFLNASVEFDPETLAPTYRLRLGVAGSSSATAVAARMGMPGEVLERANQILEREDRQLDRMLVELAASRAALESEKREALRLREETEAVRDDYRRRLTQLATRRDELFRSMREDLDAAFRDAHAQVASVIRELQRGGSAHAAAAARAELQRIESATPSRDASAALPADAGADAEAALAPVDWRRARPGDPVRIAGGGTGVLRALPDRRGRVAVALGSARVLVPAERVGLADALPRAKPPRPSAPAPPPEPAERRGSCDLRGLRVDEAIDRLDAELDAARCADARRLVVIHGVGTGALRRAVREQLARSPYVARFENATQDEGGDGATIVWFE